MAFYPFAPLAYLPLSGGTLTGGLTLSAGNLTVANGSASVNGNITATFGSIDASLPGTGFKAGEGANARQGTAVLAAGTVTVLNTAVTAVSRIQLTAQSLGTVVIPSAYGVSARVPGTSFTILASVATDTSVIAYEIFEPRVMAVPSGAAIAQDALKYAGLGYVYGGTAQKPGSWDCSSFVSYVLGHDLGMVLPGGGTYGSAGYPPGAHGPVVTSYAGWGAAATLPEGTAPSAGDLCVFNGIGPLGHIGIAVDATHMISALDTETGTAVTPIAGYGPAGAPLSYRRITGAAQSAADTAQPGPAGQIGGLVLAAAAGAAVPLIFAAAVLGAAALIGAGGAALLISVMRRQ